MKSKCCEMFAESHMIQIIVHCLIKKNKDHPTQTAMCTVSFGTEQY